MTAAGGQAAAAKVLPARLPTSTGRAAVVRLPTSCTVGSAGVKISPVFPATISSADCPACTRALEVVKLRQCIRRHAWLGPQQDYASVCKEEGLLCFCETQCTLCQMHHCRLTVCRCCSSFRAACKRCVMLCGPTCKCKCHSPPSSFLSLMSCATGCTPETLQESNTTDISPMRYHEGCRSYFAATPVGQKGLSPSVTISEVGCFLEALQSQLGTGLHVTTTLEHSRVCMPTGSRCVTHARSPTCRTKRRMTPSRMPSAGAAVWTVSRPSFSAYHAPAAVLSILKAMHADLKTWP